MFLLVFFLLPPCGSQGTEPWHQCVYLPCHLTSPHNFKFTPSQVCRPQAKWSQTFCQNMTWMSCSPLPETISVPVWNFMSLVYGLHLPWQSQKNNPLTTAYSNQGSFEPRVPLLKTGSKSPWPCGWAYHSSGPTHSDVPYFISFIDSLSCCCHQIPEKAVWGGKGCFDRYFKSTI